MNLENSELELVAVVRDKLGRVCLDEAVFFDDEKLQQIQEAVKNGRNPRNDLPQRDC